MIKYFFLITVLFSSCASISGEWGPYKRVGVSQEKEIWHFCRKDLHGPDLHGQGHCYASQECRFKKTIFRNTKKECRTKILICKWGDIQCLHEHNIFNNEILNKGVHQ